MLAGVACCLRAVVSSSNGRRLILSITAGSGLVTSGGRSMFGGSVRSGVGLCSGGQSDRSGGHSGGRSGLWGRPR